MKRLLLALLPALVACGSADASASAAFPLVVTTSNGTFVIEASTSDGRQPGRGLVTFDFFIVRSAGGAPVSELTVKVTPWMPAMGHGAPEPKRVVPHDLGHYRVEDVALYMPGMWELRTSIAGPTDEHATLALEVL